MAETARTRTTRPTRATVNDRRPNFMKEAMIMAVKVGSARIDEHGKARGGQAGDQTGKEVSTQNWYLHSKGWRVYRAKNPSVAEKIARCMEMACKNSKIGYDQGSRNTLYKEAEPSASMCPR